MILKKWKAFGWKTIKVNGHDTKDLNKKFKVVKKFKNVPKSITCKNNKRKRYKIYGKRWNVAPQNTK